MKIIEGQPWPRRSAVVKAVATPFVGSGSRNFHQVGLVPTDIDPTIANSWPYFVGDINARKLGPLSRSQKAGIVAIRAEVMDPLLEGDNVRPGVVVRSQGDRIRAGVLPEGVSFAKITTTERDVTAGDYYMVAKRVGGGILHLMPAAIDIQTSEIRIPQVRPGEIHPIGPVEFVPELPAVYRGIPIGQVPVV